MPVIGRLDDQVDAVLIAPLDRNCTRTAEAREQSPNEQAAPSNPGLQTPEEADSSQNTRARQEELPVWLL
jgi:hypothetical protein